MFLLDNDRAGALERTDTASAAAKKRTGEQRPPDAH
jgi:hypothetical protein